MEGRTILKRILAGIGIITVLGYSYFVLDDFIRGPRIVLSNPKNGLATTTTALLVAGRAIHINRLSLNGTAIPFDLEGNFRGTVLLAKGYNRITVSATDRYDRTVEKVVDITLLAKPEEPPPQTIDTQTLGTTTTDIIQ